MIFHYDFWYLLPYILNLLNSLEFVFMNSYRVGNLDNMYLAVLCELSSIPNWIVSNESCLEGSWIKEHDSKI